MNIILSKFNSKVDEGSLITFSNKDLAIASYRLEVPVSILRDFKVKELNQEEYQQLIVRLKPENYSSVHISSPNYFIFFSNFERGYEILITAYTLTNSLEPKSTYEKLQGYFFEIAQNIALYQRKFEELLVEKKKLIQQNQSFFFFNYNDFVSKFRSKGYKASKFGNAITVEFNNVELGSEEEDYILYNTIIVFVNDYRIDGYILRFKDFDYSSYWNDEVILHPNLILPYGRNEALAYLPSNNMEHFVNALISTVKEYNRKGEISTIIKEYNQLRKLWNNLKYEETDRKELSKRIFKERLKKY